MSNLEQVYIFSKPCGCASAAVYIPGMDQKAMGDICKVFVANGLMIDRVHLGSDGKVALASCIQHHRGLQGNLFDAPLGDETVEDEGAETNGIPMKTTIYVGPSSDTSQLPPVMSVVVNERLKSGYGAVVEEFQGDKIVHYVALTNSVAVKDLDGWGVCPVCFGESDRDTLCDECETPMLRTVDRAAALFLPDTPDSEFTGNGNEA